MHRISAMVNGAYVLIHLLNHLMALNGIASHQAFMDGYRHVYRQRAVLLSGLSAFVAHLACTFHYLSREHLAAPRAMQSAMPLVLRACSSPA
jgi:succinate dehydrogenase/fumarate reductase cytochrome b subunit